MITREMAGEPNVLEFNKIYYLKGKVFEPYNNQEAEAVVVAIDRDGAITTVLWSKIDEVEEIGITTKGTQVILEKRRNIGVFMR